MAKIFEMPNAVSNADYIIVRDGAGHYIRFPKLSTAQRDSLSAVNGMQVYNSTTTQMEAYQDGAWGALGGGSQTPWASNINAAGYDIADLGQLNFDDATTLTIAAGAVTKVQSYHRVDTEAAAASDDLTTISGGIAGDMLYLVAANDAHTIVLKHDDTAGAGKIVTSDGLDYSLDDNNKVVALVYDSADSHWHMVGAAGGGASALGDLTDVTITSVADNEVLAYDNGTSKWINQTAAEASLVAAVSSTDHAIARFNSTAGQLQDSVPTVDDTGNLDMHDHSIDNVLSLGFSDADIANMQATKQDVIMYTAYTSGDDDTGDGAVGTPWKTLDHALQYIRDHYPVIINTVTIRMMEMETITTAPDTAGIYVLGALIIEGHNGTNPLYEYGTCRASSATTTINTKAAGVPVADIYNGGRFFIYNGTGTGEERNVTDCTNGGATPTVVVDGANFNTDTDTKYVVVGNVGLTHATDLTWGLSTTLGKITLLGIQLITIRIGTIPSVFYETACYHDASDGIGGVGAGNALSIQSCPPAFMYFRYSYLEGGTTHYALSVYNTSYVLFYESLIKSTNGITAQDSTTVMVNKARLQAATTNVNVSYGGGVLDMGSNTETGADITDAATYGYTNFT